MINLLPTEQKQAIRAGHANFLLVRYVILSSGVLVALFIIFAGAWLVLDTVKSDAQARIDDSNQTLATMASQVKDVNTFRQNLATAKTILSQQTDYSSILLRYAAAIPHGVIIDHIELSPSVVNTPSTLTAKAKTADDVLKLKDALNASPYFTDVYFSDIVLSSSSDATSPYPYSVAITLTINKSLLSQTTGSDQ